MTPPEILRAGPEMFKPAMQARFKPCRRRPATPGCGPPVCETPHGTRVNTAPAVSTKLRRQVFLGEYPDSPGVQQPGGDPVSGHKLAGKSPVIDPAETRPRLISALEMSLDKVEERPVKKHGITPT